MPRQSLLRRLTTEPGEYRTKPGYGVGARAYVKARNTKANRQELAERIRAQFQQDDRVEAVTQVVIDDLEGAPGLRIAVQVVAKARLRPNEAVIVQIEVS